MTAGTAASLLSPVAASFAGRMALTNLLKFIPGVGSVVAGMIGAGIAGPVTYAIGKTYLEFFARSNFTPSVDEVREILTANYEEARKQRHKMEEEARREREKHHGGM